MLLGVLIALLSLPLVSVAAVTRSGETVTPNDEFFELSISGTPDIDIGAWRLSVHGMVERPLNLSYENLTAMPRSEVTAILKCPEGPSGTAVWAGVRLSYVLDMAGLEENATELVFYGADGYSSSLTVGDALGEDVLLCWEMNGETLPRDQGHPLKLVAPGKAGYKWVKWLTGIEAVDYDYKGYWESQGWDDDADLATFSDWGIHALLLSVVYIIAGLATVSGFRLMRSGSAWNALPGFMGRRFHIHSSKISFLALWLVFIYWAYATLRTRGDLFYSPHGVLSGVMIALFTSGTVLSPLLQEHPRLKVLHCNLIMFGFVMYTGVIITGIYMAWGTGL